MSGRFAPVEGYRFAPDISGIKERADYILQLYIGDDTVIPVGALGRITFDRGTYCYCGSAKRGLSARVGRHLSDPERKRWHIDHLTPFAVRKEVFWKPHSRSGECDAAKALLSRFPSVRGFGCSDCRCTSHLIFLGDVSDNDQ